MARAAGLVPAAEVRPDPATPLGTAMLVAERAARDEALARLLPGKLDEGRRRRR